MLFFLENFLIDTASYIKYFLKSWQWTDENMNKRSMTKSYRHEEMLQMPRYSLLSFWLKIPFLSCVSCFWKSLLVLMPIFSAALSLTELNINPNFLQCYPRQGYINNVTHILHSSNIFKISLSMASLGVQILKRSWVTSFQK